MSLTIRNCSTEVEPGLNIAATRQNFHRWTGQDTNFLTELPDQALYQVVSKMAQMKRFTERYCGDPSFRAALLTDADAAIAQFNLPINSAEFRPLWEADLRSESDRSRLPTPAALEEFCLYARERLQWPELQELSSTSHNPQFKAWRNRQIARTQFEFPDLIHQRIPHIPVCFELSKGCSVGCWFCGISAPKLDDLFLYSQANAQLWQNVLELLRDLFGGAVGSGFCYWATDPLDNPDYEKFMSDFHAILGVFPQTTTAQSTRDPQRVRSLLNLSLKKGCKINRFSVLSLKMLDQIHAEFSAEELAFVELVLQHPGSRVLIRPPFMTEVPPKVNAGRTFERHQKQQLTHESDAYNGSIACVSGFLFNLVDRTVKLISPCNANEKWPMGYIIFDQGSFSTIDELKILLETMIAKHMPLSIPEQQILKFHDYLTYQPSLQGFRLSTRWHRLDFFNPLAFTPTPNLLSLAEQIHRSTCTVQDLMTWFTQWNVEPQKTLEALQQFFVAGVLDETGGKADN